MWHLLRILELCAAGRRVVRLRAAPRRTGKFSAGIDMLHIRLKVVDLPTLGMPTRPALTLLDGRPRRTRFSGSCDASHAQLVPPQG